jgi:hypothetical protein
MPQGEDGVSVDPPGLVWHPPARKSVRWSGLLAGSPGCSPGADPLARTRTCA